MQVLREKVRGVSETQATAGLSDWQCFCFVVRAGAKVRKGGCVGVGVVGASHAPT